MFKGYNTPQQKYRERNLDKVRQSMRRWYDNGGREKNKIKLQQLKLEALTHYGSGKCACIICGESRLACLTLDHINGGGNKERKKYGSSRFGARLCRYLKKRGYPEGFQTLCMNCQFCKTILDQSHYKKPLKKTEDIQSRLFDI
jgi:hypothetical protein